MSMPNSSSKNSAMVRSEKSRTYPLFISKASSRTRMSERFSDTMRDSPPRAVPVTFRQAFSSRPLLVPRRELGGPYLITREVAFVQTEQFTLRDLAEPLAIGSVYMGLRPGRDLRDSRDRK